MDKTNVTLLLVAALLIGGVIGYVAGDGNTETIVTVLPGEIETVVEYVNVSVETEVEAPNELDRAVATFLTAVENEEDEDGNDIDVLGSYDYDEVEVSKVYDEWSVEYDSDVTTVDFSIKLRFDEDGERSEKETYDVTVIYEDNEDTIVNVNY